MLAIPPNKVMQLMSTYKSTSKSDIHLHCTAFYHTTKSILIFTLLL